MGTQYYCKNQKRRQRVKAHSTLNGIDYLEVLDKDAPIDSPRQRTLLVRCLKAVPIGFTADNVLIEGGVRVGSIGIEWAAPAENAEELYSNDLISETERNFFLGLFDGEDLLIVRTDSRGDFSTYRLRLIRSPADIDPPENFDPQLSEIEFSFKVECPSDFDCKSEKVCPPKILPGPNIDYLTKDYSSFRRLMLDRLSIIMPDWKEQSPADLGIVLVELLAYAGDYLSYHQDAVATEAYLNTARKRVSVRRHARLLDYPMHDGCNSRVWVCFEVNEGDPVPMKRWDKTTKFRTRLLTRCTEETVIGEKDWEELITSQRLEVFEPLHDATFYSAHNQIFFYTWGDDFCCLPKGATRATLRNNGLNLTAGDVLIFEELKGSDTGEEADADPSHRHAVRLAGVRSKGHDTASSHEDDLLIDLLTGDPIVEIEWHPEDALPFPICISKSVDGRLVSDMSCVRGNVVLADHGRTCEDESLVPESVPWAGKYHPRLRQEEITFAASYEHESALKKTASFAAHQDPREALPTVKLTGDGDLWTSRRDLLNSNRFSTEFVVEIEDGGIAHLRFGDDVLGKRPTPGSILKASYRVGKGRAGNVGAEAIHHVVLKGGGGITGVRNPLPAEGGIDAEPTSQVRLYAPYAFRKQERAVTEDDYAKVVQRHPEVQKAIATLRWTGSWYTIFITVDRKGGREVDAEFERDLIDFLERFRLTGHDIEIDAPRFVPLDIAFTVCVAPGYLRENVKIALLETFSNVDLPDGRRGLFHPDNFTFGQPVYLSKLVAAAMEVQGVQWIDTSDEGPHSFRRWGQPSQGEIGDGRIAFDRLEIARLDNDPNAPENGKIEFFMEGGL